MQPFTNAKIFPYDLGEFNGHTHEAFGLGAVSAFEDTFKGVVRVALGDINRDGLADVIATAGTGRATEVRVFNSTVLLGNITAPPPIATYNPFGIAHRLGAIIAAGDLNGDGSADILIAGTVSKKPALKNLAGVAG